MSRQKLALRLADAARSAGRPAEARAIGYMARGCAAADIVAGFLAREGITAAEFQTHLQEYAAFIR